MKIRDSRFLSPGGRGRHHRRLLLGGVALSMVLMGCATVAPESSLRHEYLMRGQILEVQDNSLVMCIGSADGAAVGQELNVIRHTRIAKPPKSVGPGFRRDNVGKVRITTIFDDHYAQATVIDGTVRENDSVETQRP